MTASKLIVFLSTLVCITETQAHPGHAYSQNPMAQMLHAAETGWFAALLIAILIGIIAYYNSRSYQRRLLLTRRTTDSITGTSTSTPTTVASAAPESSP